MTTLHLRSLSPKMQGMISRWLTPQLIYALERTPAVALLGPRQVGKTTLAMDIARHFNGRYLDLESPEDQLKLSDAEAYFRSQQGTLLILDEIQRAPRLFEVLRGVIDRNRQAGQRGGQFLLLGSASMELMRQSSESLAGRIHYLDLGGLHALEVARDSGTLLRQLWFRGGFPESYLAQSDADSMTWLEMLIRTYLERDMPQMGFRVPASRMRRLWTMLAHLQGETLNYSKLAGSLEVDGKTVTHYLDILVDLLLVRRLEPWHANVKKRLIKSPRYYIRDSGILHRLLGIANHEALLSNPVLGKSWEGFVVENLLSVCAGKVEPYFYRTATGVEVDLVLRFADGQVWAIEIKHGSAPRIKESFHMASSDIEATHKFIVYGGEDEFPVGQNTTVISLQGMMSLLANQIS